MEPLISSYQVGTKIKSRLQTARLRDEVWGRMRKVGKDEPCERL